MGVLKRSLVSLIALLLSECLVQGARISTDASCADLKISFEDHYARLQSGDHNGVLVQSITLLRELRRANAKSCDWVEEAHVSAASELAGSYLRGNPCYEQSFAAMRYAESLPEDEREHAMQDAVAILHSEGGCSHRISSLLQGARDSTDATCDDLRTRVEDHYVRLQSGEHTGVLVQSITLMREVRRAQAKECDWVENGDVDVAAATELAGGYLRGNPCYEQVFAAMRYSESHPEEEREEAMQDAMDILYSEGGCTH